MSKDSGPHSQDLPTRAQTFSFSLTQAGIQDKTKKRRMTNGSFLNQPFQDTFQKFFSRSAVELDPNCLGQA